MEIAWSLVFFTALTGCGGWLFVSIALDELTGGSQKADFVAGATGLVLLIVGGLASVTHLSHPENMFAALNNPTSGIFVEAVLVGITALFAIVYLVMNRRSSSSAAKGAVAAIAGAFGAILSFMAGHSYIMDSVPSWATIALPLTYAGTAMASGIALYSTIAAFQGEVRKTQGVLCAVSGLIALVTALIYAPSAAASSSAFALTVGGAVIVGGGLPAICAVLAQKRPASGRAFYTVAFMGAIAGAFCLRIAMWVAYEPIVHYFAF